MQWLINAANQCCAYASGSDGGRLHLKKVETVSAPFLKCRLQWLQPGYFSQCVEKLCQFGTLCFHRGFFVKAKAKKKKKKLNLLRKSLHASMYLWITIFIQADEANVFRWYTPRCPKGLKTALMLSNNLHYLL